MTVTIILGPPTRYREHFYDGALISSLLYRGHLFVASVVLPPFVAAESCWIALARAKAQRAVEKMVCEQWPA